MRAWFGLASGALAALAARAALAACATSEEGRPEPAPGVEGGVLPDPGLDAATDAAPDVESDAAFPTCSKAGWCTTELPDGDLNVKDIWPLPGRAFAIAESGTLGTKILEWTDVDGWKYIDDDTQNQVGGQYAGAIWAPNDDTVYYAVAPSYIYRGTRRSPPDAGWSWSRQKLADNSHIGATNHDHGYMQNPVVWEQFHPILGVWGIDADNVYAWYSNTVYRRTSVDGGAPEWVAEYVADDPDPASESEHLLFVSATGTGPDDVWFAGARSRSQVAGDNCAVLVHKTAAGVARVADGVPGSGGSCAKREGFALLGGTDGWLLDIQSTKPGTITGLKGDRFSQDILRISADGDVLTVRVDPVPTFKGINGPVNPFRSFWRSPSSGRTWLTAWGLVVRGQGTGANAYSISTLSVNGGAVNSPMHRVRGTSDTNLWAIGKGYAFHKTTR